MPQPKWIAHMTALGVVVARGGGPPSLGFGEAVSPSTNEGAVFLKVKRANDKSPSLFFSVWFMALFL